MPRGWSAPLFARDSERLRAVGVELGASVAAFDVTDLERVGQFFDTLAAPVDHVLVTGSRALLRTVG